MKPKEPNCEILTCFVPFSLRIGFRKSGNKPDDRYVKRVNSLFGLYKLC